MQSLGSDDGGLAVGEWVICSSDGGRHIGALLSFDEFLLRKEFNRRVESDPFGEWSTPDAQVTTVIASKKAAGGRRLSRDGAPALAEFRGGGQRSVTLSEDEWILRYKQPYWRSMVDRDVEYIPDNGCYRCMKLRSYPPDDFDALRPERQAAVRVGGEVALPPRQLQRELTRDLHRQFRLVVQGRDPGGGESSGAAPAAAAQSSTLASSSSKPPFTAIRDQAIIEDENEENAAAAAASSSAEQSPLNVRPAHRAQAGVGGSLAARSNAASVTLAFAPPLASSLEPAAMPDFVYELPGGSLSILDEYTAKQLVSLSRSLSKIPELGSKLSFGDRLLSFDRQANGDSRPAQLAKRYPPPPLREAFVLADDALRVQKLTRQRELRPVEKVTPKLRQMEDSTRLASTLAKLRYTTNGGSVASLPVYSYTSSRSHSASFPADGGEQPAKLGGGAASAPMALRDAAASHAVSAPTSPEVKLKPKGRKADAKGFALPDDGIQEKCLPEIAGIRITTLSGSHR